MSIVDKSIGKFKARIEEGASYEAQQLIKTIYCRLRSRRAYSESKDLLQQAACLQYEHNEVTCGTELAVLLLQDYREEDVVANDESGGRVMAMLSSLEQAPLSPADYTTVAKAAFKWLSTRDDADTNVIAEEIHARLGLYLFRAKELGRLPHATAHLARSQDIPGLAQILAEACQEVSDDEAGLIFIKAILQMLTVSEKSADALVCRARRLYSSHACQTTLERNPAANNFIRLLLQALMKRSLHLVRLLRREYQPFLSREPSLEKDFTALESVHFGLRSQAGGLEGLFGNIFGSLLS